jgi:hypothetical protein
MATTEEAVSKTEAVYSLVGTLIEACSCGVNCPCWIGEDPDLGECFAIVAYGLEEGRIRGLDVSGLNLVIIAHIPGNVLAGNWEIVALVDERATPEQRDALLGAFTGKLGGPLGDLWEALIGTVKGVEFVPISHEVKDGAGTLRIPGMVETEMEPYRGPDGSLTTLQNSVFSTVPGSPAWVGKATVHRVDLPQYGMTWEYEGRNAIQSEWKMEYAG